MKKFYQVLFLVSLLFSAHAFADKVNYEVRYSRQNDNLDAVAKRYLPVVQVKYGNRIEDYKKDLIQWNPTIKDWDHLKKLTPIYIDYPYLVFVPVTQAPALSSADENVEQEESHFHMGIFYTASVGNFSQDNDQQVVKTTQNSPISLGTFAGYNLKDRTHYILGSGYWSKLTAGKIEGNVDNVNAKISIPDEIGFNVYYQYVFYPYLINVYTGVDYEHFATFDINQLTGKGTLIAQKNSLVYATVGIGRNFELGSYVLGTKFSFATSLKSTTSSSVSSDAYTGSRALAYLSLKGEGNFGYHILFKHHDLSGPNKLKINRIGAGIDFIF